jgi:DNA-directed RNA polymerase specialized sigma24 family protein
LTEFAKVVNPLEIKAKFERQGDAWRVEVPQLDNFVTTAKRLDKVTEQIKDLAQASSGEDRCDIIVKVEAIMPGIICDLETAQEKSREAMRLQEEASAEIRDVVSRMRDEGLTMRDIAVLLGVTPQRIAQLAPCPTDD